MIVFHEQNSTLIDSFTISSNLQVSLNATSHQEDYGIRIVLIDEFNNSAIYRYKITVDLEPPSSQIYSKDDLGRMLEYHEIMNYHGTYSIHVNDTNNLSTTCHTCSANQVNR